MSRWNIKNKTLAVTVAALTLLAGPCQAQTILTELEPFSFGKFSLRNNNAPRNLTVAAGNGLVTADPAFVIETDPKPGEYRLEGLDPGTEVNVTINPGSLRLGGTGTAVFATMDYTISPAPLIADGGGIIIFYVGGTLRTLGDGITYDTGTYNDDLDITFDWLP